MRHILSTHRRTHVRAAAAVASLLALSAGCGLSGNDDNADDGSDSDEPIVIGMSLPLSGPVADRAKPGMEGYQYWVDELNANGGLLGREVELKVLDDGFDQQTAVSDYNRLISQDKVDLLLGTFSSDLNIAVAPIAERYGYVYVEPSGGADEIFDRNFKYLFFAQPATTQKLPDRFVELIASMPEDERPETLALAQIDDPNTTQAAALFEEQLGELGVETVYNETYAPDTTNFDSIANSIKQEDPDLVINGAIAVDGMSLIQSMQKVGFSPEMLYQMNAPTDPTYVETVGEANTEGIFTYLAWSSEATYPSNEEFVSGYTEEYGYAPSEDAANSYTAGQVLATAVEAVGSLDQDAIRDWLHENPVETIVGPLDWDESGRPQGDMLLGQFQGGSIEIVSPESAATTETIVNPKPAWQ